MGSRSQPTCATPASSSTSSIPSIRGRSAAESRGTFVAALWSRPSATGVDGLRETYPMLVRALANISLCYVPGEGVLFTTMERGHYLVPEANGDARRHAWSSDSSRSRRLGS